MGVRCYPREGKRGARLDVESEKDAVSPTLSVEQYVISYE